MPACVPISASSSASVYPPAAGNFQRLTDSANNQDDDDYDQDDDDNDNDGDGDEDEECPSNGGGTMRDSLLHALCQFDMCLSIVCLELDD